MITVALALCVAALWGTADFLGGFATRQISVLTVLFWSQLIGLAGLAVWVVASEPEWPGGGMWPVVVGGIAEIAGLGCLYRGLAIGAMGIVAPISAAMSPVVPLAFDLVRGHPPVTAQWFGIAFALVGIVLVSREPGSIRTQGVGRPPIAAGVGLALLAALGFGIFIVGLGEASQESKSWAVAVTQLTAVSVLVVALLSTRTVPRATKALLPLILAVGIFGSLGNALIALAASQGAIGIIAVLSSLYPITTILLARALLQERLGTTRTVGGLIALGGAALIAVG